MEADVYRGGRGAGKTTWLVDQITNAVLEGKTVAVVVPAANHYDIIYKARRSLRGHYKIYTEKTFENSRGYRFDHVYVDDADRFFNDPLDLIERVTAGVPVTMTYTPFEGSSIPKDVLPERRLNWTSPVFSTVTWEEATQIREVAWTWLRWKTIK